MDQSNHLETFGKYGKSFQEKIMQAMLTDKKWAEQLMEVFDVKYFELKYLQYLAERYFAYAKKYKDFPTLQLLVTIIKDDLKAASDTSLRDHIVEYLQRVKTNPDPGDLPMVKDKSLDFCRKQALKAAIEKIIDLAETEKYESMVDIVKTAISVGTSPSLGHDFFEDPEARFVSLTRHVVPTGIPQLDAKEILQGGLGKGELGVVIAPTGVGKSHFLVMLGCNAMRAGLNVLHYTFELSEEKVGVRYDSNLCDIDSNEVITNKDKILQIYEQERSKMGRLKIKYFPTNSASIFTLKSHIERLSLRGFKPDVVLIDYADIMRSSRQFDSLRHELKLIYEELRGYAGDLQIPFWTASQSNKEGSENEIVDLSNMSEAYGKAFIADFVVSISRRSIEKSTGFGRLFIAKNRAGRDGIVYPVKIDTARSKFDILGEHTTQQAAVMEDERDIKRRLKEKWNSLNSEEIGAKKVAE